MQLTQQPDQTVTGVARDLGIPLSVLQGWRRQAKGTLAPDPDPTSPGETEARIRQLERELEIARQERDILKKSGGLLRQGKQVRYAFIAEHRLEFRFEIMLRMLEVSKSGFYDWRGRQQQPSSRQQEDTNLSQRIRHIHTRSRGRYGMPRVHAELRAEGVRVSRKRVARLMRVAGLQGRGKRKYRVTTKARETHPV
ncbi:MAG: IS3 family transposase, partial [Pleurocapsa sp. SU_196_0]|nr:IS3 family transposase [Pleurocapsa sp. SU_196_0]